MSTKITCAVVGLKQGLESVYVLLHHPAFALKAVCNTDREPHGWMTGAVDPAQSAQEYPRLPHIVKLLEHLRRTPGAGEVEFVAGFDALLRRDDIQAVLLFVPDALHESYTIRALRAGKRVLCTKPMALTIESAARIAAVAKGHPGYYMLGFQYSYSPFAVRVAEQIRLGAVGTVRQMTFQFHRGQFRPVNRKKAMSGGAVVHECCHWFDLLHLFNGRSGFTKIAAFGGLDLHRDTQDIEDNGALIIEYENGVRASLSFTYFRPTPRPEFFTLNGDRGQIRGSFDRLIVENDAGETALTIENNRRLPGLFHDGYYEMHDEFAAMIREGRESGSGWAVALENVVISTMAQQAMDEGGIVRRTLPTS